LQAAGPELLQHAARHLQQVMRVPECRQRRGFQLLKQLWTFRMALSELQANSTPPRRTISRACTQFHLTLARVALKGQIGSCMATPAGLRGAVVDD